MADTNVQQATVVGGTSLIPYIRRQDVAFDADNLRPGKMARLFLDDFVMNQYAQKANKLVLNSKKILTVTPNTGISTGVYANDVVYQGSSNLAPTFSGIVEAYYSGNTTLVIRSMSGNFDVSANVLVENVVSYVTVTTASITNVINANTSDIFFRGEGLYCQNNNVYMTVLGSSGENILYVNENYATLSIGVISPNTLSTMTNDYKPGDLVYQTSDGVRNIERATFRGKVEYYNNGAGANVITLTTISGKLNVNTSLSNAVSRLWNASNTSAKAIVALEQKLYDFSTNNVLISTNTASKRVTIESHVHNSGLVANVSANTVEGGGQYVYLNSADNTLAAGNLIYFTSGTGLGQFRRVASVSGKRVTLTSALAQDPSSNTKYSVGNHIVDENGSISGIINIPEEPNFKFKTGERVFTLTDVDTMDDNDYTMKASAKFSAGGLANQMQRINMTPVSRPLPEFAPNNPVAPVSPTQRTFSSVTAQQPLINALRSLVPSRPIGDPIAQTFTTPKPASNKVSYGVFVTSVDLFFGAKPNVARGSLQLPVSVKIAETDNGFPTKKYLATATVKCKDVKVSTSPSTSNTSTVTKFTFDDPVYLLPDTEYALVVQSESPEYECYIAELGGSVLGADPPRRISEQPYAGSFFRSQNSSTWTPYQNEDLMFVINKAVFSGSGSVTMNLKHVPLADINVDRLLLNTSRLSFPVGSLDFKVKGVFKSNSAYDNYNYVKPQQEFKYGALLDASNKETSANFLNTRKIALGNANSLMVVAEFVSTDPDVSPIFNKETMMVLAGEHNINNAGISNTVISITNRGAGYNAISTSGNTIRGGSNTTQNNVAQLFRETYLANNFNVGFYYVSVGTNGLGTGAEGFAVANTDGSNSVNYIIMTSEGSGYLKSPSITIANGNATTGMITASATAMGETGKRGGNIKAKYLTRQITLEDGFESGDLRVFVDAIRPNGTDVLAYYKVLSAEDSDRFSDKPWVLMEKFKDTKSKDQNQVIELQFRPNLMENKLSYVENGKQYPVGGKFKHFAVKIALTAVDSTVAPLVRNLRIIATPEG